MSTAPERQASSPSAPIEVQATSPSTSTVDLSPRERAMHGVAPRSPWLGTLVLFTCSVSLVLVLFHVQDAAVMNANTGSRFATVEALVDFHTWSIDQTIFARTIDKVKYEGKFYSSKPPLLSSYAAGMYWLYQQVTGQKIAEHEGDVVRFCGIMTGWLFHLLFLIYLYRIARLLLRTPQAIVGTMFFGCFAYLGVGYATTINNHTAAAAVVTAGVYHALATRHASTPRTRDWVYAGLWFGFLPGLDIPSTSILGAAALCLLLLDAKKALLYFAPAVLPGLFIHLALTYSATGSFVPVYARKELYDYAGSYWNRTSGIDALTDSKPLYAFNMLLGHHGLFSMTPLFLFSFYELGRAIYKKTAMRFEAIGMAFVFTALFGFYLISSNNYGGWCVGMRWFLPFMALLILFFGLWLDRVRWTRGLSALVLAAFLVSGFHTLDAVDGPFQFSLWHNMLENSPNRGRTGSKLNLGRAARPDKAKRSRRAPAARP